VLERGERIELLVDKTENLNQSAFKFKKSSTQLKRAMWWKNIKIMIIIGIVLLAIVFVFAAVGCGGLSFPKCFGSSKNKDTTTTTTTTAVATTTGGTTSTSTTGAAPTATPGPTPGATTGANRRDVEHSKNAESLKNAAASRTAAAASKFEKAADDALAKLSLAARTHQASRLARDVTAKVASPEVSAPVIGAAKRVMKGVADRVLRATVRT